MPQAQAEAFYANTREILQVLRRRSDVSVFEAWDVLCDGTRCRSRNEDGTVIYRDSGHLSYEGAAWLAAQTDLVRWVREQAR